MPEVISSSVTMTTNLQLRFVERSFYKGDVLFMAENMQGAQIVLLVCMVTCGCMPCLLAMAESNTLVCSDTLWSVAFNNSYLEGEVSLVFYISTDEMGVEQSHFEARLSCGDLDVKGSGQQIFEKLPAVLEFMVNMPQSGTSKNDSTGDESYHSCIFEVASIDYTGQPDGNTVACRLTLRGLHKRILPSCNVDRSRTYIERTDVSSKEAQVHITFKESPNDVFTIDHGCRHGDVLGHDRVVTMQESRFSLQSPGTEQIPMVISVGFYPDCDNDSVRELYTHQRMDDCYLHVYSLCQEGVELIQTISVQASDEAMFCPPPKGLYTQVLEHMALNLRIESKPVLALILMSFNTLLLYLLLIPMKAIKCLYVKNKKTYQTLLKEDPSGKGSPGLPHGNYVIHSEDESSAIGLESESNTEVKQDNKSPIGRAVSSPDVATHPLHDAHHNAPPPLSPMAVRSALVVSTSQQPGPRPPHGARTGRLSSMPALATHPRAPFIYPPAPPITTPPPKPP